MLPAVYSIVAPTPAAAQSPPPPPTGSQAFGSTDAPETFVVPAGVVSVTIVANGAQGGLGVAEGAAGSGTGGLGGRTTATVSVTPGASLTVRVGGVSKMVILCSRPVVSTEAAEARQTAAGAVVPRVFMMAPPRS